MLPSPLHLLLIEDDPDHAALVRRHLRDSDLGPVVIEHADQLGGALSLLRSRHVDAVISDMHLPDGDFRSALPEVVRLAGDAPLIVLTSLDDQQLATTAVQLGAQDYLIKSQLTADSLTRSIRYAIHRKRTEADLRRSEERLRLAMSASHSGTFRWDLQTNAVEWDDATYEVFGVERGSVRNIEDSLRTIHPEDVAVIRELLSKRQDNSELHLEFRICEPCGKTRWLVSKGCMIHRDGSPSYIIGAVTDITAQKQAMEQLRELNDNLEARIYERTRSLVRYQERLRALTSELTLTEQRERRRLATELHDYLAQLLVVAKMKLNRLPRRDERDTTMLSELDGMLKDCLDYTRTLIAELSPTVLYESGLAAAVAWLGRHMLRHGLTVEVKADHDLPPLPEDRLVLVFQTIRELLFNVIKHARVSSAVVNLSHAADVLTVTVTDKGVGFDPAQREHDPATGGKFGLFSIRERLESLGGSFRIESHPNLGTTATLTVSCRPVVEIEEASPTRPHTRTAPRRTADRGITVLLVDDHELVREGLRSVLESSDDLEIVGEAVNGEQAVQLARTLHPEVVVMDVNMPILNGIEATRRIKAEHPTTTIIGLSVHDDPQVAQSMKSAGATAFFTKGDSSQDLCDTIRIACAPVPA